MSYTVFPKWYEFDSAKHFKTEIGVDANSFKSLKVLQKLELPYINTFLQLNGNALNHFYDELLELIILKNENVSGLSFARGLRIYSQDFSKEINRWYDVFHIPSEQQDVKTYKQKNYKRFFRTEDVFSKRTDKVEALTSEYVGFTGKTKAQLLEGKELLCRVILKDAVDTIKEFIFLPKLTKVTKRFKSGTSHYYIATEYTRKEISKALLLLAERYPTYDKIVIENKFFEESLFEIEKTTNESFVFDSKIIHYLKFEFINQAIRVQQIRKNIFECSDKQSYPILSSEQDEEIDKIMLGYSPQRFIDQHDLEF